MPQSYHVFENVSQPTEQSQAGSQPFSSSRWMRFVRWTRRVDLAPKLELLLAVVAICAGVFAYSVLSGSHDALPNGARSTSITLVVGILILPILGLTALIARRLFNLISDRRKQSAGSRLHGRIALIFAGVAVVPTLLIGIFASLLFEFGFQVWFPDRVRTVLDNAATVAEGYVREHRKIIEADLLAMANDLNRTSLLYQGNPETLQQEVFRQAAIRSLNEAIIFDSDMTVLARASFNLTTTSQGVSRSDLDRASGGAVVMIDDVSRDTDRVGALLKLTGFFNTYLYVSRQVDPTVMASYIDGKASLSQYEQLATQREAAQIRFNLMLVCIAVALLLAAIMLGLWFATRLTQPISHLVAAAEQVRQGNMAARVPLEGAMDEVGTLSRAFNRMTSQLEGQRKKLISTNEELEMRRLFIEAVLEGVSAGVIGMTAEGVVNAINRSAVDLLGLGNAGGVTGKSLAEVAVKLEPLRQKLLDAPQTSLETQVEMMIGDTLRTFDVKLSAELDGNEISGFVLTFDDMTQQLSYQRRAAWADVARRIAHEIKNPLTPIQLSAERLQRKYLEQIESDPATFERCTETIIRQVSDLRNMVDEFSSFARMPAPVFRRDDLRDVVRQSVFLHEVANPDVTFSVVLPNAPIEVPCDRRLIAQAVTNILKNALESINGKRDDGELDGEAEISISMNANEDRITVCVCDNGRGLPVAERAKLMEPYVTTRTKGTGLGLAIVKKILEDHGADITLTDAQSGGAQVSLTFSIDALEARYRRYREAGEAPRPAVGVL
ncbi:MAG: PAS domain-containing sensor histidine kinase [Pseudomonadota bacterium]